MLLSKKKIVNFLFLIGFPCYGLGNYLSFTNNFSVGVAFSVFPFALILLLYLIDLMYRGRVVPMVNRVYGWGMAFILSLIASMILGLIHHTPGLNPVNTTSFCLMFLLPFNAAIVVQVYNRDNDEFDFARLLLNSLILLIMVNLAGYVAGLRNVVHYFEGRISLPFMRGIYDASHLLSIINLMLLFYLRDFQRKPFTVIAAGGLFMLNMAIMMNINSRLSMMIFMLLLILFITRAIKTIKGLYAISLFTMPLIMSFALLIYQVLSQPFFVAILERVDKEDVTTFNGRTYIWNAVADWVMNDRRGIIFGNGYHGQYEMRMLDFLAVLWNEEHSYNFHLHSTFLEIVVGQGIVGLVLFYVLMWQAFKYLRRQFLDGTIEAPLFAGLVYMLFIWQIDIFCYGHDMGNPIFFSMLSMAAIDQRFVKRRKRALGGAWLT